MSIASPKTTRYTSLNPTPGTRLRFSVQRTARKVDKGYLADETCGQILQSVTRSAATPTEHKSKLRTYPDFCLRRTFILNSQLHICHPCFIRFMKPTYKQPIHIPQLPNSASNQNCQDFTQNSACFTIAPQVHDARSSNKREHTPPTF